MYQLENMNLNYWKINEFLFTNYPLFRHIGSHIKVMVCKPTHGKIKSYLFCEIMFKCKPEILLNNVLQNFFFSGIISIATMSKPEIDPCVYNIIALLAITYTVLRSYSNLQHDFQSKN